MRFSDVPEAETSLITRPDRPPLGAGEASLGPVIAAIANAIADALEVQVTRWPFTVKDIARDA